LLFQLNQINRRRWNYWGRPTCFARNCLLIRSGFGTGRVVVHVRCPEGAENFRVTNFWSALPFSLKVRRFRRWRAASVSVPFPCDICCLVALGELVWPARVLALSTAFNSWDVTV
jgi:hypothetical protein